MEIREVESSHIFDTADPVSRFWETVCGGKDDNKPMPTVFHNAKDYVFHPDFWEEGIKKQFLECPREQINSTPENHTKYVHVCCSKDTDDNTNGATFYGDRNQTVVRMPFSQFLEHFIRCSGAPASSSNKNSETTDSYLDTGLKLYLMQSCVRDRHLISGKTVSESILPEVAPFLKFKEDLVYQPVSSPYLHHARADINDQVETLLDAENSHVAKVILNAPSALFLPRGYWHAVFSDPGTIAVNTWFTIPPSFTSGSIQPTSATLVSIRSQMHSLIQEQLACYKKRKCEACHCRLKSSTRSEIGWLSEESPNDLPFRNDLLNRVQAFWSELQHSEGGGRGESLSRLQLVEDAILGSSPEVSNLVLLATKKFSEKRLTLEDSFRFLIGLDDLVIETVCSRWEQEHPCAYPSWGFGENQPNENANGTYFDQLYSGFSDTELDHLKQKWENARENLANSCARSTISKVLGTSLDTGIS